MVKTKLEKKEKVIRVVKDLTDKRRPVRIAAAEIVSDKYYFEDTLPLLLEIVTDPKLDREKKETEVVLRKKAIKFECTDLIKNLLIKDIGKGYDAWDVKEMTKELLRGSSSQGRPKLMKILMETLDQMKDVDDYKEGILELIRPEDWKEDELTEFLSKYLTHADKDIRKIAFERLPASGKREWELKFVDDPALIVREIVFETLPLSHKTINIFLRHAELKEHPSTVISGLVTDKMGRIELKKLLIRIKDQSLFREVRFSKDPGLLKEIRKETKDKEIKRMIRMAMRGR